MIAFLLKPEIIDMIGNRNWVSLKEAISDWPVPDIADIFAYLDARESVIVFRLLPKNTASEVFTKLDHIKQEKLLSSIGNAELESLIINTAYDDRTDLFEDLPGTVTQRILNILPAKERAKSLELLGYPEMTVGRLMTPNYVAVRSDWKVGEAVSHIRKRGRDAETIDSIFVIDDAWKLLDDIALKKFVLAEPEQQVRELMDQNMISIGAKQDREEAYHLIKRYDLNVLPVVDSEGVLLGIVTVDDIIDVLEEEVTEDFYKTSAISPVEENYTLASPFLLYKKRVGWLALLLVADFMSASVLAHYEYALKAVITLAFFIPVLIDSGGNTAAQASTLVIRSMATGELTLHRWFHVIRKEIQVGFMLGSSLAVILFIRSVLWKGGASIGLVAGISMFAIILWANLLGSLLPLLLTRLKIDPAVTSSPMLTTIVDSSGLLIYFSVAGLLLDAL
jgi:magnesium transporter